jgi:hypothetical protein
MVIRRGVLSEIHELEAQESQLIGKIQYIQEQLKETIELGTTNKALYLCKEDMEQILSNMPTTVHTLGVTIPVGTQLDVSWKRKFSLDLAAMKRKPSVIPVVPAAAETSNDGSKMSPLMPKKRKKNNMQMATKRHLENYDFNLRISHKKTKLMDVFFLSEVEPGSSLLPPVTHHQLLKNLNL